MRKFTLHIVFLFLLAFSWTFAQEAQQIPVVQDETFHKQQYNFDGAWLPDLDAAEIGPNNFATLQNMRYSEFHPEAVQGYSKVNTTALTTYTKIRNGIQLKSDRTKESYVLVQAYNSGLTASQVFQNQTSIPSQGDFEASALHTDATGAGLGRFSTAPQGAITYSNGKEAYIWAGEETRLGGAFFVQDTSNTNPIDYTEELNNTLDDSNNIANLGVSDEKVTNGSMEADSNWADEGFDNGETNERSNTQARSGTYSRKIITDNADEGIASDAFTTVTATTYYYRAWIYTTESTINVAILQGNDGATLEVDTDHSVTASTWTLVTGSYAETSGGANAKIKFRSPTADGTGTWYIDDASVSATGRPYATLFSTRPLQGVKYTIKTANTVTSTLVGTYWNGSSFTAVSSPSDGTTSSNIALGQTGTYSFTSTVSTVKPYHLEGLYLYAYQFHLTLGNADIEYVTVDAPWQAIVDVWDGVYRQPIQFQYQDNTSWEDYTLDVNQASTTATAIVADIGGFATSDDELIIGFEERMTAIRLDMLEGSVNTTASAITVNYWNGGSWTSVGGSLRDETAGSVSKMFNQTGLVSWSAEAFTDEVSKTEFGTKGYFYQITSSVTLSATVKIDIVTGIPAQTSIRPFKFTSQFKNRVLLAGYVEGKRGNRVDYSLTNAPDVFNGFDSSMDGVQSLFFGGSEPLTTGIQIYNRYGSNLLTQWIALKDNETYILKGNGPEDFQIEPISMNVGCPAPLTLVTAEVGFELVEGIVRNVAIWLDSTGPYMFDGAVLVPIKGIDKYFDPIETDAINFDKIENSRAWYDPTYKEYNLLIPSGSTQTTLNLWLVYDIPRKKWFTKSVGSASYPQAGFNVLDQYGNEYIYGSIDTGYVMRLENSNSWDGTNITQKLITGDFWPSGNIWDKTQIRYIKVVSERIGESHVLNVFHMPDGDAEEGIPTEWQDTSTNTWKDTDTTWAQAGGSPDITLNLSSGNERITRSTRAVNLLGWTHAFKFEVDTSDSDKGFRPIGWGIQWYYSRDDL
jgi:hypothetical protein